MIERSDTLLAARGLTDEQDRLITADEPLGELQENCGGSLPGVLAVPELLELVRQSRDMDLRIAREFSAYDGADQITGFVRIRPLGEQVGGGCELVIENWQRNPAPAMSSRLMAERLDTIDRSAAEATARLDANQHVQFLNATASDTETLQARVAAAPGKVWTEYLTLKGIAHQQPLHWRLLDGVECDVAGSERSWKVRLLPIGPANGAPRGFELLLISSEPIVDAARESDVEGAHTRLVGSALTPALRQPIARIIANAETIRAKLAGPLRNEYAEYAGNIAAAGQHLSGMLDDLADLEVLESPSFSTIKEKVDLGDAAKRAAGILGVRARARGITLNLPSEGDRVMARAEFRRVLQIMINLIGNAVAYSPEGSTITISASESYAGIVSLSVSDEGPGVSAEQAEKIFEKFERLGRDSNGGADQGSGLGLYISRRLALAMDGDLTVAPASETTGTPGAEFTLSLPAAE
ncbi:HAMP domain-containing histidine kinase [Erythrobacter insulae]|uniref:histidine kinase n=1 Tax=Erythrobacter insulae TaxID=2584124 RepID=A0A547PEK7_9SPHN|nr:HAMP domain-containing sensor histidine kinase [Erythrobacter insulae]TRD12559.1 HAMP domain-containing histidine kinase [Erythrobacter insulae]